MILVPAALRDRINSLIGTSPRSLEPIGPGHSNLVGATAFEDRTVVIKAAQRMMKRADVVRESVVLRLLEDTGIAPIHLASSFDDEWAVLVMERVEGEIALQRLATAKPAGAQRLATGLGAALRAVHSAAPGPVSEADMVRLGLSIERRMQETAELLAEDRHGLEPEVVPAVLESLGHRVHQRGVAFLHGDPGLHNCLVPELKSTKLVSPLRLVDWEHSGFGNPLHDISWAAWTLQHRGLGDRAIDAFIDSYGRTILAGIGWDAATAKTMVGAQMACLLVRTAEGSPERTIWLERINAVLLG
jgi:aminoglycoside phosphotransferase (APT) family kinase protein